MSSRIRRGPTGTSPFPEPLASSWPHSAPPVLVVALVLAALPRLLMWGIEGVLWDERSPLLYHAATLGFNYFEFGPVRRGLGGTLVFLLSRDPLEGTVAFHVLSAIAVATFFTLVCGRLGDTQRRWAFAALAFGLMLRWGEDAGRIDMAVATAIGCAALALHRRRPVLAGCVLGVALLMHETALIYGGPLLAVVAWQAPPERRLSPRQAGLLVLTLGAWGLLYALLPRLAQPDMQWMIDTLRSRLPESKFVDMALYFALSGMRGVVASICQNRIDPAHAIHVLGGVVVLVAAAALLRCGRRDVGPVLLATLPPLLFLSIVANDISRWTMLAVFNLWVVRALAPEPAATRVFAGWPTLLLALGFIALTHPSVGRIHYPIYSGSPLVESVVHRLHGPRSPGVHEALPRCDPQWREVLGQRRPNE